MARRRRNNSSTERETFDFSNEPELLRSFIKKPQAVRPTVTHTAPTSLRQIEDRRTYHPQGPQRPARSLNKSQHRLVIPKSKKRSLPTAVQFEAPKQVLVCIRRKTRKEVLFALKKTGAGSRARKHKRSYYSDIRC